MDKYGNVETIFVNKKHGISLLVIIIISVCGTSQVFASPSTLQNFTVATLATPFIASIGSVSVTTDKTSYNDGDKITISGITQDFIVNTPVTVMIVSSMGNIVKIEQVDLAFDRTFSTTIQATGTLWQAAGAYEVKAQYGSKDRTAETVFQFSGSTGKTEVLTPTIKVDGTDFVVKYSITNGKVLGIKADMQAKSLLVAIQTTGDDGILTVTLPRALINSTSHDNKDNQYFVLMDSQQTDFEEISTTTADRTLSIPFTDGTEEIEIIGTQIIPEFGPIAALVLAIAIISTITISAKTGLRIGPRL